ncbi:hypothetical protein LF65_01566 [Clostridium beijerinckii]|uniref:Nucleoside 2-deoxyribosyltransferase n=1 Tax=Clostridium beijerinckii TaxID=1520 RepID=A0A0B5QN04_CLOBE|nr:hypothetical protein [Clostridium beijerinckii]AJG98173.1 hypothetical protein LF65_01566 [Clostridium beijerinckii]
MKSQDFKKISNTIALKFEEILLNNCFTDFTVINDDSAIGQVFVLKIFYGEQYVNGADKPIDDVNIVRPILKFQCKGDWRNSNFDINKFFKINDEILNEFYELAERGELDSLIPYLKEGTLLATPKNIGQEYVDTYLFLSIDSSTMGADKVISGILQESVVTIGLNNTKNIEVDCMQSERKKVALTQGEISVDLNIPYDKVLNFNVPHSTDDKINEDEKYVFVVMSFQDDPLLQDAYETIKRTIGKLKKGLKCERVDEIQDDFIITDKIIECIKKAGLIIVELTGDRPNVYYELGYAKALGKRLILVAREGEKPHFDVTTQNIIFYKNSTTLEQALNKRLRSLFNK